MQNRKELPVRGVRSHDVDRSSADNHGAVPVRHMSCNDDLDTPLGQPVLGLFIEWGRISILAKVRAVNDGLALVPVATPTDQGQGGSNCAHTRD